MNQNNEKFYYGLELRDFYYDSPDAPQGVAVRIYWNGGSPNPKSEAYSMGRIQGNPIGANALNCGKVFYAKDITCKASVRREIEQAVKRYLAESKVKVGRLIKEEYCISVGTKNGGLYVQCAGVPGDGQFQCRAYTDRGGQEYNASIGRDIKSRDAILALIPNLAQLLCGIPL